MLPPKRSTRSSASPSVTIRSTRPNNGIDTPRKQEHTQSQSETKQFDLLLPDDTQSELEAGDDASFLTKSEKQTSQEQGNTDSDSTLRKKERRKLTTPQRRALESLATLEKNPSLESRRALADELGLELKIVSVWFQNRRRPTTKLKARASVAIGQSSSPSAFTKLDSSCREVLRDVSASTGGTNAFSFSNSFPSCTAIHAHGRSLSGLWTLLPSSPPWPLGQHHDTGHLSDSSFPASSSPPKLEKRISLEWACKHERRAVKRARTSFIHDMSEPLVQQSEPLPQRRSRHRTDIRPRRPSLCLRPTSFVRRTGSLGSHPYQIAHEKDILDVAIALVQLKAQRLPSACTLN
ncbi:hypothetical protein M0805_000907 [Coniferiporia weirii]|nr:hypothetical protein M0805_000907 [Coniferiporia weirii]